MEHIKNQKIQILDGGLGRELKRIGAPFEQPEWSALALMKDPDYVSRAHRNFIDAGSRIITTNVYALVPFHIGQDRFENEAYDLATIAIEQAKKAIEGHDDVKIAGCVPPPFGSYEPEKFKIDAFEAILHPLMETQKNYIDFWLCETLSSLGEANAIVDYVSSQSDKPIWLSLSLSNREDLSEQLILRSGEKLADTLPKLNNGNQLGAILFNCSQPEEMEDAIAITQSLYPNIPTGAYANNFSEVRRKHAANTSLSCARDDITPDMYLEFAKKWVDAGATIIGGCCGITPDHIKSLGKYFN